MASDIILVELGERIRQLRLDRGWRQIDLAAQAKIEENYISDLELGKREPCLFKLKALATAFGMPLHEFLKGI